MNRLRAILLSLTLGGIGFLLAQRLVVSLSDVYRFDARLAYLLPPAALLATCWGLFGRRD